MRDKNQILFLPFVCDNQAPAQVSLSFLAAFVAPSPSLQECHRSPWDVKIVEQIFINYLNDTRFSWKVLWPEFVLSRQRKDLTTWLPRSALISNTDTRKNWRPANLLPRNVGSRFDPIHRFGGKGSWDSKAGCSFTKAFLSLRKSEYLRVVYQAPNTDDGRLTRIL